MGDAEGKEGAANSLGEDGDFVWGFGEVLEDSFEGTGLVFFGKANDGGDTDADIWVCEKRDGVFEACASSEGGNSVERVI